MRKLLIVTSSLFFVASCALTVPPTPENINKIFASQDFTFEFRHKNGTLQSLSFRNDYLVYKSDQPTYRREITHDEVLLINRYIQQIVTMHTDSLDVPSYSYYVIKNTAYKVTIVPRQETSSFDTLIQELKLP